MNATSFETLYVGVKTDDGYQVTVNGEPLPARRPLPGRTHAVGFAWGYAGAGPAQLCFTLVLDATGDWHLAERSHKWLMWALAVNWGDYWSLTAADLARWVRSWRREAKAQAQQWADLDGEFALPVPVAVAGVTHADGPEGGGI